MKTAAQTRRTSQLGLSLVELMVGIAVGMFIVAAASLMVSTQLVDNRRLLVETQVQQDLRAATDIITRDLRRSGSLRLDQGHVALAGATAAGVDNNLMAVTPMAGTPVSVVDFAYMRSLPETGPYGFRLNGGALESRQGPGGWQQLTDSSTMVITAFNVTPAHEPPVPMACQRPCPDGTQDCWPSIQVRRFDIEVTGQAVSDPSVVRTLRTRVRLRNDDITFDPTGAGGPLCP
jgi:type IV pilus assembly protein PilW